MISHNHFKQPIRAFVLDMFDIRLDEHILDKIRQAQHVLERIAKPVITDRLGQHRHAQPSPEQASPAKPVLARLSSYSRDPPPQVNLNDPSTRKPRVLEPIEKRQGFQFSIRHG
jgi:hypothetical protein